MIDVALFPETTMAGPPWVCAEVRLLRPYRHPQMQRRLRCRVHHGDDCTLGPRVDAVVIQRGGPCDMRLDTLIALVETAAKRRLPIIYDLDDDLLTRHPPARGASRFGDVGPKVRYLLRAATVVIVSTTRLAERVAHIARRVAVWPNALDEVLVDRMSVSRQGRGRRFHWGYMGTPTHLQDLMSVVPSLGEAMARMQENPRIELVGVSDDKRMRQLWRGRAKLSVNEADGHYEGFMQRLAERRWRVGIAPLAEVVFNACKSDIKFLDYSAAGIPGVYADTDVYRSVAENHAGVVSSPREFGNNVLALVSDQAARERLAKSAFDYVRDQRCLAQNVSNLWSIVEECLDLANR